jgi:hypothetical protein
MDDTDAFRLQHKRKVSFFIVIEGSFRRITHSGNDTRLFLKGRTVRKGPPKRKFGADIIKMLDDLKELESCGFEGYGENINWIHKSCLWKLPYAKALILPHNIDVMHQG